MRTVPKRTTKIGYRLHSVFIVCQLWCHLQCIKPYLYGFFFSLSNLNVCRSLAGTVCLESGSGTRLLFNCFSHFPCYSFSAEQLPFTISTYCLTLKTPQSNSCFFSQEKMQHLINLSHFTSSVSLLFILTVSLSLIFTILFLLITCLFFSLRQQLFTLFLLGIFWFPLTTGQLWTGHVIFVLHQVLWQCLKPNLA